MANVTIDVRELPARFAEVVSLVEAGTEVVLRDDGRGKEVRIPPAAAPRKKRTPGLHAGKVWMADDFDAPLTDEFGSGGRG